MRKVDTWGREDIITYLNEYHPMGCTKEHLSRIRDFLEEFPDGLVRVEDDTGVTRLIHFGYVLCHDIKEEDITDFPTLEDLQEWENSEEKKESDINIKKIETKGRWIPDITDKQDVKKGTGVLITKARDEYRKRFQDSPMKTLSDSVGVYAYVYADKVIVAKRYINGWIVSAHKQAVEFAFQRQKDFVMYIGESDSFYKFDTSKIIEVAKLNHRNGVPMLNFDIKIGMNIEKKFHLSDMKKIDGTTQVTLD